MLRKNLLLAGILGIFFSMAFSCKNSGSTAAENSPPNIIFFIADDMYPENFNCLPEGKGKNLTPNLDRLAGEGVLMLNQQVVSPVCTPSRYNCLSGRFASRAQNQEFLNKTKHEEGMTCIQWNSFLTADDKMLPDYLSEAGYTTGFVGKNHVIEAKGFKKIPDYFADPTDPEIAALVQHNYVTARQAILDAGFDYAEAVYHNNPRWLGLKALAVQNMDWIASAGVDFIKQQGEKPFFLYFATTLPHAPTDPTHSFKADPHITASGILQEAPTVLPSRESLVERVKEAGLQGSGRENILWMDDALGALIASLEESGKLDNTIIFFFNDHGQKAKGTLYQGGTLNPSLIWSDGGFKAGSECKVPVSNVDFAPTILDLAGIKYNPEDFDGRSFKNALDAENPNKQGSQYFELGYARGVRKGKFKYIAVRYPEYAKSRSKREREEVLAKYNNNRLSMDMETVNEDPSLPYSHLEVIPGGGVAEHQSYGAYPGYFDPDQLYDLELDPNEQHNLALEPEYAEVLDEMKNELKAYLDKLPGKFDL